MVKTLLYDRKTGETRQGDAALIAEWTVNPDLWIWADFDDEEPGNESSLFHEVFGLHPLVIADAQRDRHPPKLEQFDEYFFLLIHGLASVIPDTDYHSVQIACFVGDRFLVTRRKAGAVSVDAVWNEVRDGKLDVTRGSAHVLYRIVRRVTDRFTSLIEGLESRLDVMEDEMFENPRDALLEELLGFGRNLKKLQRIFKYHHDLYAQLSRKDHPFISKQVRHEFIDAFEHTERLATLTSLYRELTDDLMNGYISVTSHRLNQIMKVLTVVTVIFLPLTLMVGIYGMNFENIPELKIKYAYFILLGVMAGIVTGLLLIFRKMRWL